MENVNKNHDQEMPQNKTFFDALACQLKQLGEQMGLLRSTPNETDIIGGGN